MSDQQDNVVKWAEMWTNRDIPWHMATLNPALDKFGEAFLGPANIGTSLLFPLCGKTLDMALLAGGYKVAGIEGVTKAVEEFAQDHQSALVKAETDIAPYDKFTVELPAVTGKPSVDLYVGDLFALKSEDTSVTFDRVFDRGSAVAIDPKLRPEYFRVIDSLLHSGSKWMFAVIAYDQAQMVGPPHSLSAQDITDLLGQLQRDVGSEYSIEVVMDELIDDSTRNETKFLKSSGGPLDFFSNLVIIATKK